MDRTSGLSILYHEARLWAANNLGWSDVARAAKEDLQAAREAYSQANSALANCDHYEDRYTESAGSYRVCVDYPSHSTNYWTTRN